MKTAELKSRVVPAILSGTRRDADDHLLALGPDRERAILNALSLGGQVLRFERPQVPKEFVRETWPLDERRIIPNSMRLKILHLLDRCTDDTARAVAMALENQRLRPHPFDLPKLEGFVSRYAERLGATAVYWRQREAAIQQNLSYFDVQEVTPETWADAPLRQRAKFLKGLRKLNDKAGREILEKTWAAEDPDSRVKLLSVLQVGLSLDDKPFLERIQKDRAPRVRVVVQRLLGSLSGQASEDFAVAACMERIQRSKTGILKKRAAIKLELPATVKENEVNRWILEQFAEVTLSGLAKACELTEEELIEAAEKDSNLLFALALIASRDSQFVQLKAIADLIPDAWGRMSGLSVETEVSDDIEDRQTWAEAMIRPRKWLPEVPFPAWSWLHRQLEGSLPTEIMRDILASTAWTEQLKDEKKGPPPELVQVFCALCPRELRSVLRTQLEPLELEKKNKGMLLLEILDELESLT